MGGGFQKDQQSRVNPTIKWIEVRHFFAGRKLKAVVEGIQCLHMQTVECGQPLIATVLVPEGLRPAIGNQSSCDSSASNASAAFER